MKYPKKWIDALVEVSKKGEPDWPVACLDGLREVDALNKEMLPQEIWRCEQCGAFSYTDIEKHKMESFCVQNSSRKHSWVHFREVRDD